MQQAYLLHARPYRDTSLLIDVFTEEEGRLSAVARSARGAKSRFRNLLQAFTPLLVNISGKGDLQTLRQVEHNGMAIYLSGKMLMCGLYLNELLMRLLHRHDPHVELFHAYQHTLQELVSTQQIEATLRLFEKYLLEQLGYALVLNTEADHKTKVEPDGYYLFDPQRGPARVNSRSQDQAVISGRSLLALHSGHLDEQTCLRDAKLITRTALQRLLGDKPLKSRELFIRSE